LFAYIKATSIVIIILLAGTTVLWCAENFPIPCVLTAVGLSFVAFVWVVRQYLSE
jgi:hypothetical protein